MKIKLAILDKDTAYLQRIVSVFNNKYADKLEIYSFTDQEMALETVQKAKIHVLLAGEEYGIKPEELPQRCAFAWFVDTKEIEHINQRAAICKYQKVDMVYKQILSLYSEVAGDMITTEGSEDGQVEVVTVLSPAGGVGCSTIAAAYAMALCQYGKQVLYLNLEKFGSTDSYFKGDGTDGLSEVLYAIKSQKSDLALKLKLEGTVRKDKCGVYFLPECHVALDRMEMKPEELCMLLRQIKISKTYDVIVLDVNFSFDALEMEVMKQSHRIFMVSDGSGNANTKILRAYQALEILEQQEGNIVTDKMLLLYNRFHSRLGEKIDSLPLQIAGGLPYFKEARESQIASEIARMDLFEKLTGMK